MLLECDYNKDLLIDYVSKHNKLGNDYKIIKTEILTQLIPYDDIISYMVNVTFIEKSNNKILNSYIIIKYENFKMFVRNKKLKKIIV